MSSFPKFVSAATAAVALVVGPQPRPTEAAIVATGFFSGTLEAFDESTGTQTTFATIASASDPFPGLSGIAYDGQRGQLYASARISNRLYRIDAATGAVLGFEQFDSDSSPAGLAVDASGNVYVANNGGNTVSVLDPAGNSIDSIALPDIGLGDNFPSGLAFDSQGRLLISTFAGGGVFRYDPVADSVAPFAAAPLANNQIAVDGSGNFYVGGVAFSNSVWKFAEDGTPFDDPFATIDDTLLPPPPLGYVSPDFTSPGGVVVDEAGSIIVLALGRTNPTSPDDNFQENGGIWKFTPDGTLVQTIATGATPLSSGVIIDDSHVGGDGLDEWQRRFGSGLGGADFLQWQRNFTAGGGGQASAGVVPEPSTAALGALLLGAALAGKRRGNGGSDR